MSKQVSAELETPIFQVVCPYFGSVRFFRWGNVMIYRGVGVGLVLKNLICLTKTPLVRLRHKGHWLNYSECIKEGLTI